jgi:hypothetical protein
MTNRGLFTGMLVLVFGMVVMGCDSSPAIPRTASYISGDYELIITENTARMASRAEYSPQPGDTYFLKIGGAIKSSGTVSVSGSTFTFPPSSGKPPFTATFEYGALANLSAVTLNDGTVVTLPDYMTVGNYSGGIASTAPVDTGTKIAGNAYSDKEQDSGTWTWSYKHYLLSVTYENALSTLTALWGSPDETTDCSIQNGNGEAAARARQIGGTLFEVTDYDYRLGIWTEIIVGGKITGAWAAVIWHKAGGRTEPTETGTTIGGCKYSQKDGDSGSDPWEYTNYILSVSYDQALATLIALWGDPVAGWSLQNGAAKSELARTNNGVIFEDTAWDYRLCRVVDGRWKAVGWNRAQ